MFKSELYNPGVVLVYLANLSSRPSLYTPSQIFIAASFSGAVLLCSRVVYK